jgi:hypothetical protein
MEHLLKNAGMEVSIWAKEKQTVFSPFFCLNPELPAGHLNQ